MKINIRPRRLRQSQIIRDLTAETKLNTNRMIQPYFISEKGNSRAEISSMPGIFRDPEDKFLEIFEDDYKLGINKIMLFGVVSEKDDDGSHADDDANPVINVVKQLKDKYRENLFVAADVCLCEYTSSGHCGFIKDGKIDNDRTLERLGEMALALAKTGADCLGPSDMMDSRIGYIRSKLEDKGYHDTIIMAYTAKYASSYYGPFRDAADSAPKFGNRKSYQMDYRNQREAVRELELDLDEGADIVMVKPAYLDIIKTFCDISPVPVAAYNVSGEYSMVKLMAREKMAVEKELAIENLTAIARAGADIILTYHLRDVLKNDWNIGQSW
jgi:porphobilinogen synthase